MVVSTGAAILKGFSIQLVITDLIKTQIFESLVMLGCGMVTAVLYGVFTRHIRLHMKSNILSGIVELLFWVFAGVLACRFLFYATYGALSVHVICAFICGVFLWNLLFYATIPIGDSKCLNKRKKEAASLKAQIK